MNELSILDHFGIAGFVIVALIMLIRELKPLMMRRNGNGNGRSSGKNKPGKSTEKIEDFKDYMSELQRHAQIIDGINKCQENITRNSELCHSIHSKVKDIHKSTVE